MKFSYESAFALHIVGLIEQKRADGFQYDSEEYKLKMFDTFCLARFPAAAVVTRELAEAWAEIKPTEGKNTRRGRVSVLRQLCLYTLSLGIDAYVPRGRLSVNKPILYIPTPRETAGFFEALDSWVSTRKDKSAQDMRFMEEYKIMFRLYYCCGLRLSEARLLKRENVDAQRGVLTILHSKGEKDRIVYLPQDGIETLREYLRGVERAFPNSPWLFPGEQPDKPMYGNSIRRKFQTIWNLVPGSVNADKPPTPHCLRHAFVVERMNRWMAQGADLQEMLPYLSKHLGHASPSETFYYYHLVDKAFAVVRQKDKMSSRVIPEVKPYEGT
jgi:integrase